MRERLIGKPAHDFLFQMYAVPGLVDFCVSGVDVCAKHSLALFFCVHCCLCEFAAFEGVDVVAGVFVVWVAVGIFVVGIGVLIVGCVCRSAFAAAAVAVDEAGGVAAVFGWSAYFACFFALCCAVFFGVVAVAAAAAASAGAAAHDAVDLIVDVEAIASAGDGRVGGLRGLCVWTVFSSWAIRGWEGSLAQRVGGTACV